MRSFILLNRFRYRGFNLIMGTLSILVFIVVVLLFLAPYSLVRMLARYTPVGRLSVNS
jgi:hypothetical protein